MSLLIVTVGVVLLTVPAAAAHCRIEPSARVRIASLAATAGIWVLVTGTVLTATPLVMFWHDGQEATGLGLTHLSPGGPLAWAAGGLLGGLAVTWIANSLRRIFTARRRAALPRWAAESVHHDETAGAEIRIAPSAHPIAFAVPGRDRHIVISRAVTQLLTEAELRAVLAHEGAHLHLRHDRYLAILATYHRVWGWLPGVTAVVTRLRHAIEEWADAAAMSLELEPEALSAARSRLARHHHGMSVPTAPPLTAPSSTWQLAGLALALAGLITSAGYLATHTISEMTTILGALH